MIRGRACAVVAALAVAALSLAGCAGGAVGAGGPARPRSTTTTVIPVMTGAVVGGVPFQTVTPMPSTLPGGQGLPDGATITTEARFDGLYVAAGGAFGAGASEIPTCAEGCNPVVWTSPDDRHWTVSWTSHAQGSITGEQLVAMAGALLLFNSDEGTALWRSVNGVDWQRITLPATMPGYINTDCVWAHGRLVTIMRNKYVGGPNTAYGESDAIWTSTNGITWARDAFKGPPTWFSALNAIPDGFVITGELLKLNPNDTVGYTGKAGQWTSADGVTWTAVGSSS